MSMLTAPVDNHVAYQIGRKWRRLPVGFYWLAAFALSLAIWAGFVRLVLVMLAGSVF